MDAAPSPICSTRPAAIASPSKTVVMLIIALITHPRIRQFINALPDGPMAFHYPSNKLYSSDLGLEGGSWTAPPVSGNVAGGVN